MQTCTMHMHNATNQAKTKRKTKTSQKLSKWSTQQIHRLKDTQD